MSDLLPEDEALWRYVRDTAERVARLFDYRLISTPVVEKLGVFDRTAGADSDIVSKEMYIIETMGGTIGLGATEPPSEGLLALRPEGTAGVCRAYLEHGMASRPQPVRLYYFGPMFRYDRPQAGRSRQFWQFGAECIGDASPAADVEVIALQQMIFSELGLDDLVLRINSIGTAETRRRYEQVLREHFEPHRETLSRDSQRRLDVPVAGIPGGGNVLRVLDSKEDLDHPAVRNAPDIRDFLDDGDAAHFEKVRSLLEAAGIAYEVDPRIVRGLDYYARTVWEFEPPAVPSDAGIPGRGGGQSTVGAGGRYDGLIELLGGPSTPGTGFATGIERTVENYVRRGGAIPWHRNGSPPDLYLVVPSEGASGFARRLAGEVRALGFSVVVGDPNRKVRAQMRAAAGLGARFAEVIGEKEIESGVVDVRDLERSSDGPRIPLTAICHAVLIQLRLLQYSLQLDGPNVELASGITTKEEMRLAVSYRDYAQAALNGDLWRQFSRATFSDEAAEEAKNHLRTIRGPILAFRERERPRFPPTDPA